MRYALIVAASLVATPVLAAGIEVRADGGGVDIRATAAPLSDILDELAHQTGMKVAFDGARPQALITVRLERLSAAQAVTRLMEGLGLNYAFMLDRTGTRIETLVLSAPRASAKADRPEAATPTVAPAPAPFALVAPQIADPGGMPQTQEELATPDGPMPVAVPEPDVQTPNPSPAMATSPANDPGNGPNRGAGPMGNGPGPFGPGRFGPGGMGPPSGPGHVGPGPQPAGGASSSMKAEPLPPIARPTPEP
jgi:hypothetical protein